MRIAFISYEYPPDTAFGGIGTYVYNTARILASRGHDVEVFAASHTREEIYTDEGVKVHRIKEKDRNHFAIVVGNYFLKKHEKQPFDVMEGPEFCGDAREISEECPHLPYVLCMHTPSKMSAQLNNFTGYANEITKLFRDFMRVVKYFPGNKKGLEGIESNILKIYIKKQERMEREEAHKADLVVAPSLDLYQHVYKNWGISNKKIHHVPHAYIPNKQFLDIPINGRETEAPLNIGYFGRVQYRKGISFLAEAIPLVLKKYPDVHFTFVGSIWNEPKTGLPYDEWMKTKLHECKDQLHFKGRVPFENIASELRAMDLVVLPSVWENFPNTCLEAMSAGRAIVASKHGGMAEMLNGGECGILADPKNKKELAEKIIDLVEHPEKRYNFGMKARERVLNHYNSDIIGLKKEELFKKAIKLSELGE